MRAAEDRKAVNEQLSTSLSSSHRAHTSTVITQRPSIGSLPPPLPTPLSPPVPPSLVALLLFLSFPSSLSFSLSLFISPRSFFLLPPSPVVSSSLHWCEFGVGVCFTDAVAHSASLCGDALAAAAESAALGTQTPTTLAVSYSLEHVALLCIVPHSRYKHARFKHFGPQVC